MKTRIDKDIYGRVLENQSLKNSIENRLKAIAFANQEEQLKKHYS